MENISNKSSSLNKKENKAHIPEVKAKRIDFKKHSIQSVGQAYLTPLNKRQVSELSPQGQILVDINKKAKDIQAIVENNNKIQEMLLQEVPALFGGEVPDNLLGHLGKADGIFQNLQNLGENGAKLVQGVVEFAAVMKQEFVDKSNKKNFQGHLKAMEGMAEAIQKLVKSPEEITIAKVKALIENMDKGISSVQLLVGAIPDCEEFEDFKKQAQELLVQVKKDAGFFGEAVLKLKRDGPFDNVDLKTFMDQVTEQAKKKGPYSLMVKVILTAVIAIIILGALLACFAAGILITTAFSCVLMSFLVSGGTGGLVMGLSIIGIPRWTDQEDKMANKLSELETISKKIMRPAADFKDIPKLFEEAGIELPENIGEVDVLLQESIDKLAEAKKLLNAEELKQLTTENDVKYFLKQRIEFAKEIQDENEKKEFVKNLDQELKILREQHKNIDLQEYGKEIANLGLGDDGMKFEN